MSDKEKIAIELIIMAIGKYLIKKKFNEYVKNKNIIIKNNNHDGSDGHWLEKNMGLKINNKNEPDIYGYEMKNHTKSGKITFIDKTPSKIFLEGLEIKKNNKKKEIFWKMFKRTDSSGLKIGGWKVDIFDKDGQTMWIDNYNNICILYNFTEDKRDNKNILVSEFYKNNKNHIIIIWESNDLKVGINNKWNQRGFFICKKNEKNEYSKILFGKPISFNEWIIEVKNKNIYYDGYSSYGGRWRGVFRASNKWFERYITEEY
tara:strand:+ start:326 stop:1105 length:780 start_codon:yes stop_codon:yes gene_type:complete